MTNELYRKQIPLYNSSAHCVLILYIDEREKNKVGLDFKVVPPMLRGSRMCVGPEHQRWLVIEGGHKVTKTTISDPLT